MKKKILLFLVILILSVNLANAIKILTVNETEMVSLKPMAWDEDADELSYSFTEPLDENGLWQTDYGDAGDYKITVTASDGQSNTSEDVLLVVKKKNIGPTIDLFSPEEFELSVDEGKGMDFSVEASDLNKDVLDYMWQIDEKTVSEGQVYKYNADYWDEGAHEIRVMVSDGEVMEVKEWVINVNDVDRKTLLDNIVSLTASEGQVIELTLPDFEKYNLGYTISEPIGNDNR